MKRLLEIVAEKRSVEIIASVATYWIPMIAGILLIFLALIIKNVPIGISGMFLIVLAGLFRLYFNNVVQEMKDSWALQRRETRRRF